MDDDQTPDTPDTPGTPEIPAAPPPRPDQPASTEPFQVAPGPSTPAPGAAIPPPETPSPAPEAGTQPAAPRDPVTTSAPDAAPETSTGALEAAPKKKKGLKIAVAAIAVVLVLAIAAGAVVLNKLSGTGDVLVGKVPANSLVYATAYLDPAAHQKMNLESLVSKFPALKTSGAVSGFTNTLDSGLSTYGLNFEKDIQPWLGSQVGFSMQMQQAHPVPVILVASTDDGAASAALKKLRSSPHFSNLTWSDQDYKGATISIGNSTVTPSTSTTGGTTALAFEAQALGAPTLVYTVSNGTVIVSNSLEGVKAVIDTSAGDAANLGDSSGYQTTMKTLPTENLAVAYVNIQPLVQQMQNVANGLPGAGAAGAADQFALLKAIKGIGETVSAESNGIAVDVSVPIDSSKLSASQKSALEVPPGQNSVLAFTPSNALGVFAGTGFDKELRTLMDQLQANPMFGGVGQSLGIDTLISSLSGDIGVEVQPGPTAAPTGAIMIGTSDTAAMQAFLDRLAGFAQAGLGASAPVPGGLGATHAGPAPQPWTTEDYNGVSIKELALPAGTSSGFAPAYAVTDGMAIIGASPDAVKSVIDAHANNQSITSSANYKAAIAHGSAENNQLFYADVQAIAQEIRGAMSSDEQQTYDSSVAPNIAPVKSVIVTSTSSTSGQRARVFILIT